MLGSVVQPVFASQPSGVVCVDGFEAWKLLHVEAEVNCIDAGTFQAASGDGREDDAPHLLTRRTLIS